MLNDIDTHWLIQQIVGTAELLGQEIKPASAAMLADDLSCYSREILAKALNRTRKEHVGRLTTKAIIDRIDELMGRPTANEAWSVALTALDERKTVVWSEEVAQAWGVARIIAEAGDMIGARMSFIATYDRLVRTARDEFRIPVITVSMGWDADHRTVAIEKAVQLGYIAATQAKKYLPAPKTDDPGFDPVALLLTGAVVPSSNAPPDTQARLAKLRDQLKASGRNQIRKQLKETRATRKDLAARKKEAQEMTDSYLQIL